MKKIRYLVWALMGAGAIAAGCAFMDLVWSRLISRMDLARSGTIAGVETCREMSHLSFQTWLIFNPRGRRTYYLRSECFQTMAVRNRDEELCREVVERKSPYFDGSAVSPEACREAVRKQRQADQEERARPETVRRVRKITITRNAYGDAAQVRVLTDGTLRGRYRFSAALHDADGNFMGPLFSIEAHLGDPSPGGDLGATISRGDVRRIVGPHYRDGGRYLLTVSLELLQDDAGRLAQSGVRGPDRISTAREFISFE